MIFLENCNVSGNGIILPQLSLELNEYYNPYIYKQKILPLDSYNINKINDTILCMSVPHGVSFFHFFTESCAAFLLNKKRFSFDRILINKGCSSNYMKILSDLGINTNITFSIDNNCIIQSSVIFQTFTSLESRTSLIRNSLNLKFQKTNKIKIIFDRREQKTRKLKVSKKHMEVLQKMGFIYVNTDFVPYETQKFLFSNCSHLISVHGGSLTNIIFLEEGTKVLEIVNPNSLSNIYKNMCEEIGIEYNRYVGKEEETHHDNNYKDITLKEDFFEILEEFNK